MVSSKANRDKRIWSLSKVSFFSDSSTSKFVRKHWLIMALTANGLSGAVSQYQFSLYG